MATPAIKEQQQIADELESKLAVCDKKEETISQRILMKAFDRKLI